MRLFVRLSMCLSAIVIALVAATSISQAQDSRRLIIIEPGRDRGDTSNADLLRRINRLEQAVQQLQDKVFELSRNSNRAANPVADTIATIQPAPSTFTTCFIESTFEGTFMETAPTETAAKAGVLKKCHQGKGGLSCTERNVKCGK